MWQAPVRQIQLIMISKYILRSKNILRSKYWDWMGLNKVDDYFRKDTELQNYTKTGVKRIINSFIFQNNFQFLLVHFLYFEKMF